MDMRFNTVLMGALVAFVFLTAGLGASDLHTLLEDIGENGSSTVQVDLKTLTAMMEYAEANEHTIFELLNQSALYLKTRSTRVRIDGDDLRTVNRRFDLGGERVNTLLPVEKIRFIEIGSDLTGESPEMEVYLVEKHSDFLELGDFFLSEHFGFDMLEEAWFRDGFG